MNFCYIRTSDDLRLPGVLYDCGRKDTLVVCIHGMSGNILENYFADVLGNTLTKNDISFLYTHNRGYNHVNDIATSKKKKSGGYQTVRIGATYERFTDCILDIDAWLQFVYPLGYKRIILMGHSLGCNKIIYYYSQKLPRTIAGMILASPADMVGLITKREYQSNSLDLYKKAKTYIAEKTPRKLLPSLIWDWFTLSAQTFLDLFSENTPVDNLPILRNPQTFVQLATVDVPILGFVGEFDDITMTTLEKDLDCIEKKATHCPAFTKLIIPQACHTYDGAEDAVAETIVSWIHNL
ncbi:MAG: alpha/beta hydrolase [Candidatus Pacebacteria bacterium]|nr:alpha/beta hydrolase [Candidatus Paceibacterota bacterium]